MGCRYLYLPGYSPWYPWKLLFLFVNVQLLKKSLRNMVAQRLTTCSGSSASGGVTPGRGAVWITMGTTWFASLSPPWQVTVSQLSFACLHLLLSTMWEKDLWFKCLRPSLQISLPLLRAWDRCQGCCLIVGNIKADSDDERNLSSAEINEMPLQSALLFRLWSMRPWE